MESEPANANIDGPDRVDRAVAGESAPLAGHTAAGHSAHHDDPLARLIDREHMLAVFRRELPRLSDRAIAVTGCRTKLRRRRAAGSGRQLDLVYRVAVAVDGEPPRD